MRTKTAFVALILVALLAVPSLASAAVIPADPNTPCTATSAPAAVGKWGSYKITETFYWPNASTVRIATVRTTVTSTHLAYHYVDWCRVQIRSNGSTAYDVTNYSNHYIINMGSTSYYHYPNKYVSAVSNTTGSAIRYVGAYNTPLRGEVVTPFLWLHVGY